MERPPFSVVVADQRVDAWSEVRLPFEPRGWLRDYRTALRQALRSMSPTPTSVLYAEYAAPDRTFVDLENVLLYNLGSGCYSHLARHGIVCRRTTSADHLHRVTYRAIDPTAVVTPPGRPLATARLTDPPRGSTVAHWWGALRPSVQAHRGPVHLGPIGIEVIVGSRWTRALAPAVKSLLDGLVAALHAHDGSARDQVSAALGYVGDPERLWALSNDPSQAVLGRRRLVRPHGLGIAWNPADERCDFFAVRRGTHPDALTATVVALADPCPRATAHSTTTLSPAPQP